jgi:enterochelin esterase family protein
MSSNSQLISPRLKQLQQALAAGNTTALELFWQEVAQQGTPLVEAVENNDEEVWVTFLWRAAEPVENVVVIGQLASGQNFAENRMAPLPKTNLWYKTCRLRSNLRAAYCLSPNDSLIPFHQVEDWAARTATWQPDPLNPRTLQVPEHETLLSILELPAAPPQPWFEPRPGVPTGDMVSHRLHSRILDNERTVWIYTPPGYSAAAEACGLLILFDGWAYLDVIKAPTTLDNLLGDGLIPPFIAVLVDIVDFGVRSRELPCYPPFADFISQELLPWVSQRYRVAPDPARRIVGGFSFGGLAAAFMGLRHSEQFGNVLSQSGSFWWKPEDALEPEWLTRQFALKDKVKLQIYLDVGLLETEPTYGNGPSMLVVNRHLRNVLQAKGYPVHYAEYAGGHDYLSWRGSFAEGLMTLMGTNLAQASQ